MSYLDALTDSAKVYSLEKTINESREEIISLDLRHENVPGRFSVSRQIFRQGESKEARIADSYQYIFQTTLDYDDIIEKDVVEFDGRKYLIMEKIKVKGRFAHHLVFYLDDYHG